MKRESVKHNSSHAKQTVISDIKYVWRKVGGGGVSSLIQCYSYRNCLVSINPFKPEFTIVIFIHYKPRIAVAILDL